MSIITRKQALKNLTADFNSFNCAVSAINMYNKKFNFRNKVRIVEDIKSQLMRGAKKITYYKDTECEFSINEGDFIAFSAGIYKLDGVA